MTYFDKYGFGELDDIHVVKKTVEQAFSINLEHHLNSRIGDYYSLSIPEVGFDVFKLRYNKICDEEGYFLQYREFSTHVLILLTWAESLDVIDEYRDKLLANTKAEFLSRKEIL
jgi:hypothetical protein